MCRQDVLIYQYECRDRYERARLHHSCSRYPSCNQKCKFTIQRRYRSCPECKRLERRRREFRTWDAVMDWFGATEYLEELWNWGRTVDWIRVAVILLVCYVFRSILMFVFAF